MRKSNRKLDGAIVSDTKSVLISNLTNTHKRNKYALSLITDFWYSSNSGT